MAPNQRARAMQALRAMKMLGIPEKEVVLVLKNLLAVFDKNWELIEQDNYRALADAYFDSKEVKDVEDQTEAPKKKHDGSERPGKRPNLCDEDRRENEIPSSKPCLRYRRTESSSGGRKTDCERDSTSVSHDKQKEDFIIPKLEEFTSSDAISAKRASMERPGSLGGSSGGNSVISLSSSEVGTNDQDSLLVSQAQNGHYKAEHFQGDLYAGLSSPNTGTPTAVVSQQPPINCTNEITKRTERVNISVVDEIGNECLPRFNYIRRNIIYQNANLIFSLARIADEDCCTDCSGDCVKSLVPCACARETGGEFVYTPEGLLKESFLTACISEPEKHQYVYCEDCPTERIKNEYLPEKCKGHPIRNFIKECWERCGCDLSCGNRVVQRGISCKLQVFMTPEGKGWGVRTLEVLEKGTFVCEYVGEILTNTELYERNMKCSKSERHTYPVTLDADWGSEKILKDEDALCLDATYNGNVVRFINHRCGDANLKDIPVQVETPDRHYYHVAFFTTRKVSAFEELTWDYGIDFGDVYHPIKAFPCNCGSKLCRDTNLKRQKGKRLRTRT